MDSRLQKLIIQLSIKNNPEYDSNELEAFVCDRLTRYDLIDNQKVPSWIFDLFEAILDEKETGKVEFEFKQDGKGDWLNLLGQLHEYIEMELYDEGEYFTWTFKNGLLVLVSFESDLYEVKKIKR